MQYFKRNDGSFFMSEAIGADVVDALGLVELSKYDYEKHEAKATADAKAEQQQKSQAKALEREAIDEIIREQFTKEIAARIKEKQAKLANRKNAK